MTQPTQNKINKIFSNNKTEAPHHAPDNLFNTNYKQPN